MTISLTSITPEEMSDKKHYLIPQQITSCIYISYIIHIHVLFVGTSSKYIINLSMAY